MSSRYLQFTREEVPGRKTPVVQVRAASDGTKLGHIAWYSRWRQFCFFPAPQTLFNVGCMTDIQQKIAELRAERNQ